MSTTCKHLERPIPEKQIVRFDAYYAYLKRLEAFPIITREEEYDLAVRYRETGAPELAKKLICANLRMVVSIANTYSMMHRNLPDLIQEGNVGLMVAVQKYDPYRGTRFSSYATFWIRAHMLRFLLDNAHLIRMGASRGERKIFFNLNKVRRELEKGTDEKATAAHIAKVMNLDEREVSGMMARMDSRETSLDENRYPFDDGEPGTFLDSIPAEPETRPDHILEASEEEAQQKSIVQQFSERLEGRDKYLFEKRFLTEPPIVLDKIAKEYGVSKQRAQQLETALKKKLRAFVKHQVN